MAMVINPYFQNYYKIFSRNKYQKKDKKNRQKLEEAAMNTIINMILKYIQKQYKYYKFWEKTAIFRQFEIYVAKACELCWIMVLNAPQLYFYPRIFSETDKGAAKSKYTENIDFIYKQNVIENAPKSDSKEADSEKAAAGVQDMGKDEEPKKEQKKSGKKKKKKKKKDDDEKNEEEEMDLITKEHDFHPQFSKEYSEGKYDDDFHECLNETTESDDEDGGDKEERRGVNHNGELIAYVGWPSLVRVPQLEKESHTQITRTFAYYHRYPKGFMSQPLSPELAQDIINEQSEQ